MEFKFPEEGGIPIEEVESVDEHCEDVSRQVLCPMVPFLRKHMRHWLLP